LLISSELFIPVCFQFCTGWNGFAIMCKDFLGDIEKRLGGVTKILLRAFQFFFAGNAAVRNGIILPGGVTVTDMRAADDDRWTRVCFGSLNCGIQFFHIIAILHMQNLPMIGFVAFCAVFSKGYIGGAINGDAVVIIEDD